jgi:FkbM family methyltransferase
MRTQTRSGTNLGSLLRGFAYWLLTKGPVGAATGTIFRGRAFDRLGPVAVPQGASSDTIGAIVHGVYEYPERYLISRLLPTDVDCVELGCSIGIISRVILSKLQPGYRLIAVEASQELLSLAETNMASAGFRSRSILIHGAIHYNGDFVVFANDADHIRGKIDPTGRSLGIKTPCVTLKQIIKQNNLGKFSLVMDIEGSEFNLIERDRESLDNCQAIIAELHADEATKIDFVGNLHRLGFTLIASKHSVFAFQRCRKT